MNINPFVQRRKEMAIQRPHGLKLSQKFLLAFITSSLGFAAIMVFLIVNNGQEAHNWWLLIPALALGAGVWVFGNSWWQVRRDQQK